MKVTRKFEFSIAHRILGHKGKCRHLHGHNLIAEITVEAQKLNDIGMVVDFSYIKDTIGKWIDDNWDHNTILHCEDPLVQALSGEEKRPYILTSNPTSEILAQYLGKIVESLDSAIVSKVRIYETSNCWADWERDNHDC